MPCNIGISKTSYSPLSKRRKRSPSLENSGRCKTIIPSMKTLTKAVTTTKTTATPTTVTQTTVTPTTVTPTTVTSTTVTSTTVISTTVTSTEFGDDTSHEVSVINDYETTLLNCITTCTASEIEASPDPTTVVTTEYVTNDFSTDMIPRSTEADKREYESSSSDIVSTLLSVTIEESEYALTTTAILPEYNPSDSNVGKTTSFSVTTEGLEYGSGDFEITNTGAFTDGSSLYDGDTTSTFAEQPEYGVAATAVQPKFTSAKSSSFDGDTTFVPLTTKGPEKGFGNENSNYEIEIIEGPYFESDSDDLKTTDVFVTTEGPVYEFATTAIYPELTLTTSDSENGKTTFFSNTSPEVTATAILSEETSSDGFGSGDDESYNTDTTTANDFSTEPSESEEDITPRCIRLCMSKESSETSTARKTVKSFPNASP